MSVLMAESELATVFAQRQRTFHSQSHSQSLANLFAAFRLQLFVWDLVAKFLAIFQGASGFAFAFAFASLRLWCTQLYCAWITTRPLSWSTSCCSSWTNPAAVPLCSGFSCQHRCMIILTLSETPEGISGRLPFATSHLDADQGWDPPERTGFGSEIAARSCNR